MRVATPGHHVLIERLRTMLELPEVDAGLLTTIVGNSMVLHWETGPIVESGEPADALYLVLNGTVTLEGNGSTRTLGHGEFFGGRETLAGGAHQARAVPTPACELIVIPRPALQALVEAAPDLADRLRAA